MKKGIEIRLRDGRLGSREVCTKELTLNTLTNYDRALSWTGGKI